MSSPEDDQPPSVAAAVRDVDADGVLAALVGTACFLVATVLAQLNREWLTDHGHQDWLAISACGAALGIIGVFYCRRRQLRDRRRPSR